MVRPLSPFEDSLAQSQASSSSNYARHIHAHPILFGPIVAELVASATHPPTPPTLASIPQQGIPEQTPLHLAGVQWACAACTFLNAASDTNCSICESPQPIRAAVLAPSPADADVAASPSVEAVEWACAACTGLNAPTHLVCSICETPRSQPQHTPRAAAAAATAAAPPSVDDCAGVVGAVCDDGSAAPPADDGASATDDGASARLPAAATTPPAQAAPTPVAAATAATPATAAVPAATAAVPAAAAAAAPESLNDYEMALLMQAQFDEEHDVRISQLEANANRNRGNIRVSYDNFRPARTFHEPAGRGWVDPADGASDDEYQHEKMEVTYDQGVKALRTKEGELLTKHNPEVEARRNLERIGTAFPLSFPSGDLHGKDFKCRVSTKVYNKMKVNATKTEKSRHRVREKKDNSTSSVVLDTKTRLILFKMVNSGLLEGINGAISTGKEAVVFHAVRRLNPEDPDSPEEDCAVKVFKTTLTEFKQRQQFLHGDRRFEDRVGRQSARKLVKLWAEKEMSNLTRMERAGMNCPAVVSYNKHVLVMSFIGERGIAARKLRDVPLSKKMADECMKQVRHAMHTLYHECRLVHADLSEYNILYHKKKIWVIDVGQAVEPTHPRAHEYLFRDCLQVGLYLYLYEGQDYRHQNHVV